MASVQKSVNFTKQTLSLSVVIGLATILTACGGGGGGGSSSNTAVNPQPAINTTPTTTAPISTTTTNPTVPPATTATTPEQAAFNLLNRNRTQCGFGGLTLNQSLTNTATNHANYLKLVSESNNTAFASHNEKAESFQNGTTLANTGIASPYFSGLSLNERLSPTTLGGSAIRTNYASMGHVENIAMATLTTSAANYAINKTAMAEDMLRGLFAAPYHMQGLLYPSFKDVGINYQLAQWSANGGYSHGSILELVSALASGSQISEPTQTLSFPCDNVVTAYELNNEYPNPFSNRDLSANPVGQPIYVRANSTRTIVDGSATVSVNGQSVGYINTLTAATDPNKLIQPYEIVFIPNSPLLPSTTYQVNYQIRFADGATETKNFSFTTQAKTN